MAGPGGRLDEKQTGSRVDALRTIIDSSVIVSSARLIGDRVHGIKRDSSVHQWLTREREPDIVVIDLRETWTIGPIIALLERLGSWAAPYWRLSALKRGMESLVSLGESAADTRVGRFVRRSLNRRIN